MARPAIAALDDAREAATALLVPLDAGRWARLALLAALVGGGGGLPAVRVPLDPTLPVGGGSLPAIPALPAGRVLPAPPRPTVVLALLVAAAVLGLAYALAGAVAEFVLVVAVRDGRVRLRAPAGDHLGRGLRLFAFRLFVRLVALALVGVPAALVLAGAVAGPTALLALGLPVVVLGLLVLAAAWLVVRLTTDLVVPTMIAERTTPADGWRRLVPVLRDAPVEVGLYLAVRAALSVAAGIVTGLVAGLGAVVTAVPFVLVALVGVLALGPSPGAGGAALGLLALAYLLVAGTVWLAVRVPVVVLLRAFALAVLGRLAPPLDLLGVTGPAAGPDGRPRDGVADGSG